MRRNNTNITNDMIDIQALLKRQMHRLDEAVEQEISIEIGRSGALSQNAQAYLKSVATRLRVKDMADNNKNVESAILKEIGVEHEEQI